MSAWGPETVPSSARLLRNWMPELPDLSLTLAFRTKSAYGLSVARYSFFASWPSVLPRITPSSTVNRPLFSGMTQPARSLPLNRGLNPSRSAAGVGGLLAAMSGRSRGA